MDRTDFTTRDPSQPFTLLFAENDLAMQYANFRNGCFDIKLFHFTLSGGGSGSRMTMGRGGMLIRCTTM